VTFEEYTRHNDSSLTVGRRRTRQTARQAASTVRELEGAQALLEAEEAVDNPLPAPAPAFLWVGRRLARPDQVSLVFDRRLKRTGPRATPGRFRTRIITEGVTPSLQRRGGGGGLARPATAIHPLGRGFHHRSMTRAVLPADTHPPPGQAKTETARCRSPPVNPHPAPVGLGPAFPQARPEPTGTRSRRCP